MEDTRSFRQPEPVPHVVCPELCGNGFRVDEPLPHYLLELVGRECPDVRVDVPDGAAELPAQVLGTARLGVHRRTRRERLITGEAARGGSGGPERIPRTGPKGISRAAGVRLPQRNSAAGCTTGKVQVARFLALASSTTALVPRRPHISANNVIDNAIRNRPEMILSCPSLPMTKVSNFFRSTAATEMLTKIPAAPAEKASDAWEVITSGMSMSRTSNTSTDSSWKATMNLPVFGPLCRWTFLASLIASGSPFLRRSNEASQGFSKLSLHFPS